MKRSFPSALCSPNSRRKHAEEFFASEYQLSRQEWMDKNQLVYSPSSPPAGKRSSGKKPPPCSPRGKKGLSEALACPGTLDAEDLEAAVRAAFQKYLQFDGTVHKKGLSSFHFSDKWAPLLTKLLPVEIVRTDELTVGRSAMPGENGMMQSLERAALPFAPTSARRRITTTSSAASAAASTPPRRSRALSSALHRRSPRLPSLVHKGCKRIVAAAQRGHAAPLRASRSAGQAEPRRLRARS